MKIPVGRNRILERHFLFYKLMENLTLTLPKDDVILIVKSLKIAQAKKKCEIRQHFRKNQEEHTKNKFSFIHKANQLTEYIEYLIK